MYAHVPSQVFTVINYIKTRIVTPEKIMFNAIIILHNRFCAYCTSAILIYVHLHHSKFIIKYYIKHSMVIRYLV